MPKLAGRWIAIALLGFMTCAPGGESPARASDPTATTLTLLEIGWKPSLASFTAAREEYRVIRTAGARDLRASYAMTLVAIRHHNAREAVQFIDEALAPKPGNLHLRKARLWLHVWNKDYKGALADMPSIARDLAVAAKTSKAGDSQFEQQAETLGELLAYIGGPAEAKLADGQLDALEAELHKLLPKELQEAFAAGKKSVEDKQRPLADELHEARLKAKVDADADRVAEIARLRQFRDELESLATTLQPRYEQQAIKLSAQLEELRSTNTREYETDKDGKRVKKEGKNDSEIQSKREQLANVPFAAEAERAQIAKRDDRATTHIAQLEKQLKVTADVELADNPTTQIIRKRMGALTRYCEFPLEEEREKLVQSFRKK